MQFSNVRAVLGAAAVACLLAAPLAAADDEKWIPLFDGKSLDGWEKVGQEASMWEVKDGAISGSGPASMLVCTKFEFRTFISLVSPHFPVF
jgi:hypothetical protein